MSLANERENMYQMPAIWSFTPFFTIQCNPATRARQLTLWSELIKDYCRHYKIIRLPLDLTEERGKTVQGAGVRVDGSREDDGLVHLQRLVANPVLGRRLSRDALRTILDAMVDRGEAIWAPTRGIGTGAGGGSSQVALVLWKTIQEWSDAITAFLVRSGRQRAIMTLYELSEGDEVVVGQEEIAGLDQTILVKALEIQVKAGRASWLKEAGQIEGVKFF